MLGRIAQNYAVFVSEFVRKLCGAGATSEKACKISGGHVFWKRLIEGIRELKESLVITDLERAFGERSLPQRHRLAYRHLHVRQPYMVCCSRYKIPAERILVTALLVEYRFFVPRRFV